MIYIDPPYNTGKDFVYKDNFRDNIANYKEITSQTTRSNPETNGRYHTDWLNMMYPRLKLARNLLKDDGVVFISIDNNEISNLKKMCDEIFGEENNLQTLIWKKKYTGGKHSNTFAEYHEYILVYCKDDNNICDISMDRPDEEKSKFEFSDNYIETRGRYYIRPLKSNLDPRPTLIYPIELPDGSTIITQWIVSKSTFEQMLKEERVLFKQKKDGNYQVYKKYYENDGEGKVKIPSIVEFASNSDAKEELKKIFNISQARELPFQTPKPTKLIKFFIKCFTDKNDIILDFFSGSSSTADSVIQTNAGDNNERKFIMVQLPELTNEKSEAYKSEYKNICEIGKERIRRTGDKIVSENKDKEGIENLDIGFKVFKLDSSNLKSWDSSMENLEQKLLQMDINLKKIEVKKIYYMKYY